MTAEQSPSRSGRLGRAAVSALLVFALLAAGLRTVRRNRDWADEERLYRAGVAVNPPKGKEEITE